MAEPTGRFRRESSRRFVGLVHSVRSPNVRWAVVVAVFCMGPGWCLGSGVEVVGGARHALWEALAVGDAHSVIVDAPRVNNRGDVAFREIDPSTQSERLWFQSDDMRLLVAASDHVAEGTAGSFDAFSDIVLADDGTMTFAASLRGPRVESTTDKGWWAWRDGESTLIAQRGGVAPSRGAPQRFSDFETPLALSGWNAIALYGRTLPKEGQAAQSSGLWTVTSQETSTSSSASRELALVAEAGMEGVQGDASVWFSPQGFEAPFAEDPVINGNGTTVFRGFASQSPNELVASALWIKRVDAPLESLFYAGGDPPEVGGVYVSFPSVPTINDQGQVAFLAFYRSRSSAIQESSDVVSEVTGELPATDGPALGLWTVESGRPAAHLLSIGDPVPGGRAEERFVDVFDPLVNARGDVFVTAAVKNAGEFGGRDRVGIWLAASGAGELGLVAASEE
ncbi:MAG: hypothetical protein KDA61_04920, partial [Planctomycetales bacterium]|nr:hypothetical protein [Planctomycetales bacterium]